MKKIRRYFICILTSVISCTNFSAVYADEYNDVPAGVWYTEAVMYCIENNIIDPLANNLFDPHTTMKRGDVALALWRIDSSPSITGNALFSDISEDTIYYGPAYWAADAGIMTGYNNNTFGAENAVTREQIAAILYRYEIHKNGSSAIYNNHTFSDGLFISDWANQPVSWAFHNDIITGRPGNLFAPQEEVTRAEAAMMLYYYLYTGNEEPEAQEDAGNFTTNMGNDYFSDMPVEAQEQMFEEQVDDAMITVNITIGNHSFSALFYDNDASRTFIAQMPITLQMADLNLNEKYYYLSQDLPASAIERPSTLNAGEIMCWSQNCLVLFYETLSNSYGGYVRLGYIENINSLTSALGSGSVTVTFTVQ